MCNLVLTRSLIALSLGLVGLGAASAPAPTTTAAAQASLSMTVYQQGFALVRDERTVDLALGRQRLHVLDISDQIDPQSVLVTGDGLTLQAADYTGASLSPHSLLMRYVGKNVRVLHREPGKAAALEEEGVLLGAAGGVPIVQIGDRIEIGGADAGWRLAFDAVPEGLQGAPSLALDLENATRGPQSLSLTYLSRGLSWRADYVGILRADNELLFSGWVSLENATATGYPSAHVQLLAGEVNRPDEVLPATARMAEAEPVDLASAPVADYHLYDLPDAVTLLPAQRRQVRLLAPRAVAVEREYRVSGEGVRHVAEEEAVPVAVRLRLPNSPPALGRPLPGGLVRVYAAGPQGILQYLGEDRIGHTPQGETVTLSIGTAFDVTAKRTTTAVRRVDPQTTELEQQVRLVNRKDQPVTVVVAEQLRGDWEILASSHPFRQASAHSAEWRIDVPAGGELPMTYRARIRR